MTLLTLDDYFRQVNALIHDAQDSAWTRREKTDRINDARKDVSLDMQCVHRLVTDAQLIRGVERYRIHGAVCGVRILDHGEGFEPFDVVPLEFEPPPPGGIAPEAVAHADWEGRLVRVEMLRWGEEYTHPPSIVTRIAPKGRDPHLEPVTLINVINVLSISPIWNTMRYTMAYRSFGLFQAWCRALQQQGFRGRPGIWTMHTGDMEMFIQPTPDQHYRCEFDTVGLARPLHAFTVADRDIPDPHAQAVQLKAASYLFLKHMQYGQSQYYDGKYDARVPRIIAGAGGTRILNPYNKSYFEKMRRF